MNQPKRTPSANPLVRFWHLNRMGRLEGAPMAAILVLLGSVLGTGTVTIKVLFAALAMGAIAMNYVYLVNGVTDVDEDSVNSPNRPLVRGDVGMREAKIYVNVLLALGVLYPFFLHSTWSERAIVWIILAMGVFYSLPPVRFKRYPPAATIYLVINFNLPIVLGHEVSGAPGLLPPYLFATVALFLANMPLKDIGDAKGDAEAGIANWSNWLSQRGLMTMSAGLSVVGAAISAFVLADLGPMRWAYSALVLLPALNVAVHLLLKLDRKELFTRGVRGLIVLCTLIVLTVLAFPERLPRLSQSTPTVIDPTVALVPTQLAANPR
jgi:4-hydroxybenzoate polyprenyltransferase